jgi:hypothetical protein
VCDESRLHGEGSTENQPYYERFGWLGENRDAKIITATTIGQLDEKTMAILVHATTKVDTFKAGLTVSTHATVEILAGAGGVAVTDQATTNVTATMVIQVTAQDGTTAEYQLSTIY